MSAKTNENVTCEATHHVNTRRLGVPRYHVTGIHGSSGTGPSATTLRYSLSLTSPRTLTSPLPVPHMALGGYNHALVARLVEVQPLAANLSMVDVEEGLGQSSLVECNDKRVHYNLGDIVCSQVRGNTPGAVSGSWSHNCWIQQFQQRYWNLAGF